MVSPNCDSFDFGHSGVRIVFLPKNSSAYSRSDAKKAVPTPSSGTGRTKKYAFLGPAYFLAPTFWGCSTRKNRPLGAPGGVREGSKSIFLNFFRAYILVLPVICCFLSSGPCSLVSGDLRSRLCMFLTPPGVNRLAPPRKHVLSTAFGQICSISLSPRKLPSVI